MAASAYLDTSVIVRYLTDDPPAMAARAAEIIDTEDDLILSELVLVETAYVLATVYDIGRTEVVEALQALVLRTNIRPLQLSKPMALEALSLCGESHRHSFVDAFQWALARELGPRQVYSFDRRFPCKGITVDS